MKKKKAFRLLNMLVTLVMILTVTACATAGKSFPVTAVKDIKIGETTKKDIRSMFGNPWRTGLEDGQETWTYGQYRYSPFKGSESSDLVVRFDNAGKVGSYSYSTTNPDAGM